MPWFRGDCHVHTHRSHGADQTPAQIVDAAHAAGLDFIAVTDHQAAFEPGSWTDTGLLVIPGQEMLTPYGHWLALGLPPDELRVVAHPFAPYPGGTFQGDLGEFDAVEVWNGRWRSDLPWNADNEQALAAWSRSPSRPAVGNSDAHLSGQLGSPQLVVQAPALTVPDVLAAIRAGRCWTAGSRDIDVGFSVTAGSATAHISGVPTGTVTIHTDGGPLHRETLPAHGSGTVRCDVGTASFVRLEIRHPDGQMAALTNPLSPTTRDGGDRSDADRVPVGYHAAPQHRV